MTQMRRALVTGMGILCPVGQGREAVLRAVRDAHCGLDSIEAFDTSPFRTSWGGEVRDFDPSVHLTLVEREAHLDRTLELGLAAARMAVRDAGLFWCDGESPGPRCGVVVGTCNGGLRTAERQYSILLGLEPGSFDRRMNFLIRYHALGRALACGLGVTGPVLVVTTACSSSTAALGVAQELIAADMVDVVLAGGADALCLSAMAGFDALKATSTGRTAPFSTPVGLNLGEGAAFWVLEDMTHALSRGARIDGELLGYSLTCDAHHPTAPDPRGDGAFRTMATAQCRGGISLDDPFAINAHGTGTQANDRTESKAISRLLGERSRPVYSFKSQVGHCLGAAGAVEATAGLLAMGAGLVPATVNFSQPRPGCPLDYVPNTPRVYDYRCFISSNYAFGGNNASIAVGTFDPTRRPTATTDPRARVVITGGSAVTSLGLGSGALLQGLRQGRRGLVDASARVGVPTRAKLAGLVPEFDAKDVDRRLDLKDMNLLSRYATAACRLALGDAGLRIGPKEGIDIGLVNGVYVGPEEEDQMKAVIPSHGAQSDITCFTRIVANATAGFAAGALMLKGYSTTISQGADAGLFSMVLASAALRSGQAKRVLAGAADEVYSRYFRNYDELELLHTGDQEAEYGLHGSRGPKRVLGEGAAYVVLERLDDAMARGATSMLEVAGAALSTEPLGFFEAHRDPTVLAGAIERALAQAHVLPRDLGAVLWSPQGNASDERLTASFELALGQEASRVPLVTSVFHTGLLEATSGVATLCAVLEALRTGEPLWRQLRGPSNVDTRSTAIGKSPFLAVAGSEIGFYLALVLRPLEKGR
jgi:3-oxoacyl-[acyl-carrier-protein] synthase II